MWLTDAVKPSSCDLCMTFDLPPPVTADVPSRPSAIALLHCTGSEMLIGWRAPANHGGDPVRGYYLDQREKSQSSWREVNIKPAKERVYEVSREQQNDLPAGSVGLWVK